MDLGSTKVPPGGTRIVNGVVIKGPSSSDEGCGVDDKLIADKIGATGVQRNGAVKEKKAEVEYWAVAGGGARLDGKGVSPIKDKDGKEIDPREVRAKMAEERAKEQGKGGGKEEGKEGGGGKRRSFIGNKFSKRKVGGATAFGGGGNTMM